MTLEIDKYFMHPHFRDRVRTALTALAGNAAALVFTGRHVTTPQPPNPASRGQVLLHRIIQSHQTVRIQRTAEHNRCEPVPGRGQTVQQAMRDASNNTGVAAAIFLNQSTLQPNTLPLATVSINNAQPQLAETPTSIVIGHELVHADRFTRGGGAFGPVGPNNSYNLTLGSFLSPTIHPSAPTTTEIYTVGLPPAANTPANPDGLAISENNLRQQLQPGVVRVNYP